MSVRRAPPLQTNHGRAGLGDAGFPKCRERASSFRRLESSLEARALAEGCEAKTANVARQQASRRKVARRSVPIGISLCREPTGIIGERRVWIVGL